MKQLTQLFKQAQEMQEKMKAAQEKLEDLIVEGQAGAGMVKVVMTCKGEVRNLSLDPSLVAPDDKDMLEDLIVAAFNDARHKGNALMEEEMAKVTSGMALPDGFKMPF
jgi:DNA-binding YbaB/EbfC family protein